MHCESLSFEPDSGEGLVGVPLEGVDTAGNAQVLPVRLDRALKKSFY